MSETRTITMGGREFSVPPFSLRINKRAYPLCAALSNTGLSDQLIARYRTILAGDVPPAIEVSDAQMDQLIELALVTAQAAEPEMTADAFEAMTITPEDLFSAFLTARYQTGYWVAVTGPTADQDDDAGEAEGA